MRAIPNTQLNRIETILLQEGMPMRVSTYWSGNISASNIQNIGSVIPNMATPYVLVNAKANLTANKDVVLYVSANGDITGSAGDSSVSYYFIPSGGYVTIEFPTPMHPLSSIFSLLGDALQTGTAVKIGMHGSGTKMLNDFNFSAKRKIYWMGDSITDFTANLIGTSNFYQFQVRDWLTKNSNIGDYRLTQKAWGGRTSNDFDKLLIQGSLFVENPDIIFYQLGMNDASQSVGTTAYVANMQRIIKYKQTFWKDAILVFLGTTPAQNNTLEASLVNYRNAMSNMVSATGDIKIKYINLDNVFNRTLQTSYADSDTSGNGLHPGSLLSHTGIANAITSGISSWGVTI